VIPYLRLIVCLTAILASSLAQEPPPDLVKRVAENERENEAARLNYMYRQSVVVDELEPRGGRFREVREVIFSPAGERTERVAARPFNSLQRLILTAEDFEDIRHIQPLMLTPEMLPRYMVRFRGEENVDGVECWVLEITPRQLFAGFRMFDGMAWVDKRDLMVVRIHGQAVPPVRTSKSENLFPRFTTIRRKVDGKHWFPELTYADDLLPFRTGALRMRLEIRYADYKRFGAESKITFEPATP
jgi:hypothetical protein